MSRFFSPITKDPGMIDPAHLPIMIHHREITADLVHSVTRKSSRLWIDRKKLQPSLDALYVTTKTPALQDFLSKFAYEKTRTESCFVKGIQLFMEIANLPYEQRAQFFGHSLLGLHYRTDLSDQWNEAHHLVELGECTTEFDFPQIGPSCWGSSLDTQSENFFTYHGSHAAEALDSLLQGPTTIDCGMFTQLAILFGMRYVLGNEKFNRLYENTPLVIGQYPNEPDTHVSMDNSNTILKFDNPLHAFFSSETKAFSDSKVYLAQVENHPDYAKKHPAGAATTHNCVVIRGKYNIFDPTKAPQADLSAEDLRAKFVEDFNAPQDRHDAQAYVHSHCVGNNPYQKALLKNQYETHANRSITTDDIPSSDLYCIAFEFERFLQRTENLEPHAECARRFSL